MIPGPAEAPVNSSLGAHVLPIMAAVIIGTSANQIAWNIVGVALPRMQGAYSASPDQIAWVMSSFVLGSTLMFACSGWLAVRFGRRRVFLISIAVFTVTLFTCASAPTLETQVFWRFIQGLAGAALIPLGHAIAVDAYPRSRFGEATVVWSIGLSASSAIAPVIGGFLVNDYGWRSVYYFMMPLSIASFIAAWAFVPETEVEPRRRMDWLGIAGLIVLVAAVQVLLNWGQRLDWFAAPEIQVCAVLALLGLYIFVLQCVTSEHPFLAPEIFRDLNFLLGLFFGALQGGLVMLSLVIMPLLLEGLVGYSVVDAGNLMLPRGIGVISGMILIAKLSDRVDPRYLLITGFLGIATSSYFMSGWNLDVRPEGVAMANFILGMGGGIAFVPITMLAFSSLPKKFETEGFALFYLVYYTGVAVGIAAMLNVVSHSAQVNHAELSQHVNLYNKLFHLPSSTGFWNRDDTTGLTSLAHEISRQANMIAYDNGFTLTMICALGAIPLVLLFRRPAEE